MKISVSTVSFLCIITTGLAKLPLQEPQGRDFSSSILQPQIQHFHFTSANNQEHAEYPQSKREVRNDFDYWRNPKADFKRAQSNYRRQRPHENYSSFDRNENPSPGIFRTYGRGKAQVTRQGQTVNVSNELGRNVYKNSMPLKELDKSEYEMKPMRHRGVCRECPTDQTVVATKGNNFAILPEPCQQNPKMWNHHSGPEPGSKIQEGVHSVRGYIGPKKKFCQYHYQVVVRKCEPLKLNEDITTDCSGENIWGSICNVSCGNEKQPVGPTTLECNEDLTWSNPMPTCKSKFDCSIPKVKSNSKISCHTPNMMPVEGDFIPSGSTCKFMQNEKQVSIACKDGRWRITKKNKNTSKKSKEKIKPKADPCNPNPCQNGGTCLRSESNKGSPICKCRPQTQGVHCEMRECYYNICENDGLCLFQNEERICYCSSEYSGDTCQHYNPS